MKNDANIQSVCDEICKISENLNDIVKKVEAQRLEILKCENIIKPYQLALDTLKNNLNDMIIMKSSLQHRKLELLKIIDYGNQSEDDGSVCDILFIKHEKNISKSPTFSNCNKSVANESGTFPLSYEILEPDGICQQTFVEYKKSEVESTISRNVNENTVDIDNEVIDITDLSLAQSSNVDHKNSDIKSSQVNLTSLKRKIDRKDDPISKKAAKLHDDISVILEFKKRNINCIIKSIEGILFGGTKGLLQLRHTETLDIIRKYIGHEMCTVEHLILVDIWGVRKILSCSNNTFIAFDLETGGILATHKFNSHISALTRTHHEFIICTKSGSFYSFDLVKLELVQIIKVPDTFVQSLVQSRFFGSLGILMGCENGQIYRWTDANNELKLCLSTDRSNIYDLIALPASNNMLSYSDRSIFVFNKNTLAISHSQDYKTAIVKVKFGWQHNLLILFADGSICIYPFLKQTGLPDFWNPKVYHTGDCTLKDFSFYRNKVYLIGGSTVYLWQYRGSIDSAVVPD